MPFEGAAVQRQRSISAWMNAVGVSVALLAGVLALLLTKPPANAAGAQQPVTLARADAIALAVLHPRAQIGQVVLFRAHGRSPPPPL